MQIISIDAAAAISGISRRTLWRRVADGQIASGPKDPGGRSTLGLDAVLALMEESSGLVLGAQDQALLLRADAGDATAQADMGALFYLGQAPEAGSRKSVAAALYWLRLAAAQDHADAMHWLGMMSADAASGADEPPEERARHNNPAIMWIARAAAAGHTIAQQQMAAMMPAGANS